MITNKTLLLILLVSTSAFSQVRDLEIGEMPGKAHTATLNETLSNSIIEDYAIPISLIDAGFVFGNCDELQDFEKVKTCTLAELSNLLRNTLTENLADSLSKESELVVFAEITVKKTGRVTINSYKTYDGEKIAENYISNLISEELASTVKLIPPLQPGISNKEPQNVRAEITIRI